MDKDRLTDIMIVTYNRLDLTKKTFESLLETTKSPFNLIIIDNGSKDNTAEYLFDFCYSNSNKGFFKNFSVTKNNDNLGIAIGRNQALQHSTSEWLCTLDNDVILPDNWLSQCIDILQENKNIGMMGVNFEKLNYPLISVGKHTWQNKIRGNLGTACAVFNRSLHKKIGYFNTEYGIYGEEDADFGMRVRVAGLKMGYLKENGTHLGEGENDTGSYREFKTKSHQNNLNKFYKNCDDYANRRKPIYINFNGVK